jgi:phenylalanyl-tRNA synthetase alpha chain
MEKIILTSIEKLTEIKHHKLFCQENGLDIVEFVGQMKSLEALEIIKTKVMEEKKLLITKKGKETLTNGKSFEFQVLEEVKKNENGIFRSVLEEKLGQNGKHGLNQGMANKWYSQAKDGKEVVIKCILDKNVEDEPYKLLTSFEKNQELDNNSIQLLKKGKLIEEVAEKYFFIIKGASFTTERKELKTDLTHEMLLNKSWETSSFKKYNYNAIGKKIKSGYLHPLLKVRTEFREIFFEMGFEEMMTDNFVESSFWNFDTLFVPQKHP